MGDMGDELAGKVTDYSGSGMVGSGAARRRG
jgi:hypothetical protein